MLPGSSEHRPVFGPHLHNPAQMHYPVKIHHLHQPPQNPTFLERTNERLRAICEGGPPRLSDTGRVRAPKHPYGPYETGKLTQINRRRNRILLAVLVVLYAVDRIYDNYQDYCDAVFHALSSDELQRKRTPFLSFLFSKFSGYQETKNIYAIVERVNRLQAKEFIRSVRVVPYGIMGSQLNDGSKTMLVVADTPDSSTLTVDAVPITALDNTSALPGASTALRRWLARLNGETDTEAAHPDVFDFTAIPNATIGECHVKRYGERSIVHCVIPDFRHGIWTKASAISVLANCYSNIFKEFASPSCNCERLRLPILSAGGLAGTKVVDDLPNVTIEAMIRGFTQLTTLDQETLLMRIKQNTEGENGEWIRNDKRVDLCVFVEREWPLYDRSRDTLAERIY